MSDQKLEAPALDGVAIIGMAGRFPGARNVTEFWRNQLEGIEAISQFRVDELEIANAAEIARDPRYVKARSVIDEVDMFDAEFFGIYPREAELMDPQQRLFLECCWQALEDAGYVPDTYQGQIAVYAGSSVWSYFLTRLCTTPGFIEKFTSGYQVSNYVEMMGNSLDFLSTRVSYKLNLRGPSFTMLSACSTSLLAVTQACQSLLTYQSDMALAGGVSITLPQKRGYYYQEGGMVSPDGHCRAFDADAQGTVFGSGLGVVLLKRLDDAIRDGDNVHAVIRGFAVNNDGSAKVGYAAPSVEGQAGVVAMAHEAAGVEPDTIGYIEAHGTGTPLGDPIELAGLTQAFRARTERKQFCTIGTAKTNVGHLDVAAGVTGLINATNIVRDGIFPPTLHFKKPNPNFDFAGSPFRVNVEKSEWRSEGPRRAGVSSFGVGGTNAHVILEQAREVSSSRSSRTHHLLPLSARSPAALERAGENLAVHLESHPGIDLADVAWTLQTGRKAFDCRRAVVAESLADVVRLLSKREPSQARAKPNADPDIYFLFPGQGSQHPNMAREIYDTEKVFRDAVDRCAAILEPHLGTDIRTLLYPEAKNSKQSVTETVNAQPAIFIVEYALARLWMSWGIRPKAMAGHSVGEFVAACLAGVITLEDALGLVALRGRMMQQIAPGGMLSVRLPEAEVRQRLPESLSLAAVNSPSLCVVAGALDPLAQFENDLNEAGIACRRLVTSHAFHSSMMDPLIKPLAGAFARTKLNAPEIPYLSGVTGTWIGADEARDPQYWARHAREPVRFSAALQELRKNPNAVLLEVGPGNVLATLARQHGSLSANQVIVSSLSDGFSGEGDGKALMSALGALWTAGAQPDWPALYKAERRRRVSLPTYPFERKRYWLETAPAPAEAIAQLPPVTATMPETFEAKRPLNQGNEPVNIAIVPLPAPSAADRAAKIEAALVEMFADLSGTDLSATDNSSSFLELGFDSLFLTQAAQAIQERFGAKVTFRQLLNDVACLRDLTEYLASNLPADAFAEPLAASVPQPEQGSQTSIVAAADPIVAMAATPFPEATPGTLTAANGAPESPIERVMREQLQAMNMLIAKQLETLNSVQPRAATASTSAAPIAPRAMSVAQALPTQPAPGKDAPRAAAGAEAQLPAGKSFGPYKPPQTSLSHDLTDLQREHLNALIDRVTRRTAKSKSFTQEHRKVLADPRVVSGFRQQWKKMVYSIVTNRSEGARIWDIDGNEYIDLVNGFGQIMLGHRPEFVTKAIEAQLRQGFEIGPQTPLAGEVAEMFCEMTGNERMAFCNTGSEAVLAAMRASRTVTGRNKIVMFSGDYHGMFDEVLAKGFTNKTGEPQSVPIAPGIPRQSVSNVVVLDYGTPQSLEWIRKNAGDLAAVLVEPVQSRHPSLQPIDFLKELRKITEDSGAALIFDEVVTGFRVHQGGCQALFGIRADLATYGKVLAGGMPAGVLAGKARFMDALDGGMWQFGDESFPEVGVTFFAGTFVRHPLVVAAMKAVLQNLREQGPALQERLNERTASLVRTLNEVAVQEGVPTRIENFGSLFYFGFPTTERFASLFYFYLRDKGIHVREGFPCFLTTSHSDADMEQIVRAFRESAIEMRQAGFFEEASAGDAAPLVPTAESEAREAPMTEPQLEVWLSDQLGEEASCCFNESISLHLRGNLNERALGQALDRVIARHQALRATFDSEHHRQTFVAELKLDMPIVDLTQSVANEREPRLAQIVRDDACTPFSVSSGSLVRSQLVKLSADHHVLIFTAHHIVCDGWSINILVDELSQAYNAFSRGQTWNPPAAMAFADYANSQARFVDSSEGRKVEAYWLEQFRQPVSLLNLPTDRPRPAIREFDGATYRTRIDREFYERLKKFGAAHKCTLFVTLLSGLQVLLARLSGQSDVVIGVPTAGQSLVEDAVLVGHCVNFIPLRGRLSENPSAAEFLAQMKQTVLAGYDNQNYTYGRLVRKLSLQRDPSRLPLTEIQFNLERLGGSAGFDGLQAEIDPNPKSFVNFDLFLNIVESKDGLTLDCDYNTGLFDEATIARWLDHYKALLEGMAADAGRRISMLPLLADNCRRQLLETWNDTRVERQDDLTVHGLFEAQAMRTPNSVAAVFGSSELTYAELDARASQLANHLRKLGVKPGVLVGVFVERSMEMLIGLLGTLKAGGAYVPIDPTFPPDRVRYVIQDAGASVVLAQTALTKTWSFGDAQVVRLDGDWGAIACADTTGPSSLVGGEDLAYVIYTSGSTGKPKGVEIPHRAVVNLLQSMLERPGLAQADVLAAVTTLSFDISGLELFLPLCVGARVAIVSRETAQFGVKLLEYLKEIKATVVQATPVTWQQLLEAGWNGEPTLKVLCGGEAFPRELADELVKRAASVWNMYGPTETTIWSAVLKVEAGEEPVPIGHPIANTAFVVLDQELQLVPIGIPGELYISGRGLARGYHNRPDLTAERFVENPFEPGTRMYRTGDLVRRRQDGTLEFLGRLDNQIKLRGFRIELGEIESTLGSYPGVAQAVVSIREDVAGEKRLVGYVLPAKDTELGAPALREHLLKSLPAYMAPAAYVTLQAFPLTPNGKVDRGALPAPDWSKQQERMTYVQPRNAAEETMAEIWAEVLRLERVGINDNLFELGADSLHVFQITARANKAGIAVTPRQVLQLRTIASIFDQAINQSHEEQQSPNQSIKPVPRQKYRLTPQVVRQAN